MESATLKKIIEERLPGAEAEVRDPMRDGQHLEATVVYAGFEGLSLVKQHQLVMQALRTELGGELHALALQTCTPAAIHAIQSRAQ